MGNGTDRPVDRPGAGLQQSVRRQYRTNRVGTTSVSVPDWWRVQDFWRVHSRVSMGSAQHQQRICDAYLHSDLFHCAADVRREYREMVRVCVGLESVCVVLVDPLDLGHDLHAIHPCMHLPIVTGTRRSRNERDPKWGAPGLAEFARPGTTTLGSFRSYLWNRRTR